jgi:hypothetical protein
VITAVRTSITLVARGSKAILQNFDYVERLTMIGADREQMGSDEWPRFEILAQAGTGRRGVTDGA